MDSDPREDPAASARRLCTPCRSERLPAIDTARCTGCGRCGAVCDPHLLSLEVVAWKKFSVLHEPDRCTGCSACAVTCPFHAITMRKRYPAATFDGGAVRTSPPEWVGGVAGPVRRGVPRA